MTESLWFSPIVPSFTIRIRGGLSIWKARLLFAKEALMQIPTKSQLEMLRKKYPAGARIELTKDLDDPYTVIPAGSRGTVRAVDDIGTILMSQRLPLP